MSNLEKELKQEVDETTTQDAPIEEENDSMEEDSQSVEENDLNQPESEDHEDIDYAAELKRLQEERDNYKKGMLNAKKHNKELQEKLEDEPLSEISDEVIAKAEEAARKQLEEYRLSDMQEFITEELSALSKNPDEQQLILHHYKNTLNKSGLDKSSVRRDLGLAKIIANEKKILSQNAELRNALRVKSTTSGPSFNGQRIDSRGKRLSPQEKALVDRLRVGDYVKKNLK